MVARRSHDQCVAITAERYRLSEFVASRLAVDVDATLQPTRTVPVIDPGMTGISTSAIIVRRAHREHVAVPTE